MKQRKLTMRELKRLGFTPKDLLLLNEERRRNINDFAMGAWLVGTFTSLVGLMVVNIQIISIGGVFLIVCLLTQYLNKQHRNEYTNKVVKFAFRGKRKC